MLLDLAFNGRSASSLAIAFDSRIALSVAETGRGCQLNTIRVSVRSVLLGCLTGDLNEQTRPI